jgi:hypothetical protein
MLVIGEREQARAAACTAAARISVVAIDEVVAQLTAGAPSDCQLCRRPRLAQIS